MARGRGTDPCSKDWHPEITGAERRKIVGAWRRTQQRLAWLEGLVPSEFTPTREQIDGLKRDLDRPARTGCRHDRKRRCATCRENDERLALGKTYKTGITPKNTGTSAAPATGALGGRSAETPTHTGQAAGRPLTTGSPGPHTLVSPVASPTHAGAIDAQPATDGAAEPEAAARVEAAVAAGSDPALPSTRMVPIVPCTSIGCSRPGMILVDGRVFPVIRYCQECWDASLRARGCVPLTDQEPQAPAGATTEGLEPQATQDATAPAGAKARRKTVARKPMTPEIEVGQNANPCACRGSILGSPFHSLEKCSMVCEMCEAAPAETLGAFPADDPMSNNMDSARQKICLACAKKSRNGDPRAAAGPGSDIVSRCDRKDGPRTLPTPDENQVERSAGENPARSTTCPICNGTGEDPADRGSETDENGVSWDCPECGGTGTIALRRDEFGGPAPRPHPPEVDFAPEVFERLRSLPQPPNVPFPVDDEPERPTSGAAIGPTNEARYRAFVDDVEAALVKAEEDLAASQKEWQDRSEADLEDARKSIQRRFALETPQHAEWLIRRLRELAAAREALAAQAKAMDRELEAHMRSLSERFEIPLGDVLDGMLGDQTGRKRPKKSAKTLEGDLGRKWTPTTPKITDRAAADAWAEKNDDLANPKFGAICYRLMSRTKAGALKPGTGQFMKHLKATGEAADGVTYLPGHDELYIAWRSEDGGKTTLNVSRLARGGPMVAGEDEDGVDEIEGGA